MITLTDSFGRDPKHEVSAGSAYRSLFFDGLCRQDAQVTKLSCTTVHVSSEYHSAQRLLTFESSAGEMRPLVTAAVLFAFERRTTTPNLVRATAARLCFYAPYLWVCAQHYETAGSQRDTDALALAAVGIEPTTGIRQLDTSDILRAAALAIDTGQIETAIDQLYEQAYGPIPA